MKDSDSRRPPSAPLIPLADDVVFPFALSTVTVRAEADSELLQQAAARGSPVACVMRREERGGIERKDQIHTMGSLAKVHGLGVVEGSLRVVLHGMERIRVLELKTTSAGHLEARYESAPEAGDESLETRGLAQAARDLFVRMVALDIEMPNQVANVVRAVEGPRATAYLVASMSPLPSPTRQELLELDSIAEKLRRLIDLLGHEVAVREISHKIRTETSSKLAKQQREHILREHLESIQRELGDPDPESAALDELRTRLAKLPIAPEARKEAERELERLRSIPTLSPEYGMVRTYLDSLLDLPWGKTTGSPIDLDQARRVLDEDHHDLEDVKRRVLEYLAVKRLRQERASEIAQEAAARAEPILCFLGPPGVGKTSLGQSIARAMGREFVRVSLGGTHDEAEIRGHRRTYIGAMPGRILQALSRAHAADPVFMLDEIDKLGVGIHGDPSAALLEVLDPSENHAFVDNYFGVPFDLSQVLFVCTANTTDHIPRPLLDRTEVLHLAGYTDSEKVLIARRHLFPKQRASHGLRENEARISDDALLRVVRDYTREAGVRELDRHIATVLRKIAWRMGQGEQLPAEVRPDELETYLGPQRLFSEVAERVDRPGVATALAWTPNGGGDILFVEATIVPAADERLLLTGMLGDVMKESAQAALSYLRSNAASLGIAPGRFEHHAVHVHVPVGAIPKDGPSAGVPILVALASIALGRPVRNDLAMTGEITLRGKVLPVGGIKEKVLAAHRAGLRAILLPRRNESALADVPSEVREDCEIILVDSVDAVLHHALGLSHDARLLKALSVHRARKTSWKQRRPRRHAAR